MNASPGSQQICPVCFWQDDDLQLRWPDWATGPNRVSLIGAQQNFMVFGACQEEMTEHVRSAEADEPADLSWRPIDLERDRFEPSRVELAPWPDDRTGLYWWRYRDTGFWRRAR